MSEGTDRARAERAVDLPTVVTVERMQRLEQVVRDLRVQVRELTSGSAELTVRRLAVVDERGQERIVASAPVQYGDHCASLVVQSPDGLTAAKLTSVHIGPGPYDFGSMLTLTAAGNTAIDLAVDENRGEVRATLDVDDPEGRLRLADRTWAAR